MTAGSELLLEADEHMEKSLDHLKQELMTIRTGRANPGIIEHLQVEYYGSPIGLQQIAAITAPEARQLLVQPYDKTALGSIEKAIRSSDLGFNPTNDGNLIRIIIPQLTEERRRELVRLVHKRVEDCKVAIRNVRREVIDQLRKQQKAKEISEDELSVAEEDLQKATDRSISQADAIGRGKEAEMMEV